VKLAGLILAAGFSSRMGTPKALLDLGGETFVDRLTGILGAECDPVIVVVGHEAEAVRAGAAREREAVFVTNPSYSDGQLSSLQCGLRAVPDDASGFLFTPVDHPAVEAATVALIARAFRERRDGISIIVPRFEGRHGHPVCCARELLQEFLELTPEARASDAIRAHARATHYLDTGDAGVLRDIDDCAAYDRLVRDWQAR
jgi:molybdenum cofactor cytidylyltransferase